MKCLSDKYSLLYFKQNGDERGSLVVIEGNQDIPFDIKRVFYIYASDSDVIRGQHANKQTEFVLINISGTSKIKIDNGFERRTIELNKPHMGIYLSKMLWKDMFDFSCDSILLVLASEHYDSKEYIRNYDEFLSEAINYCCNS